MVEIKHELPMIFKTKTLKSMLALHLSNGNQMNISPRFNLKIKRIVIKPTVVTTSVKQ
jgi:hypothetical protein